MASRRSRMKVLPNLGGRGNKETNKPVTNHTGKDSDKTKTRENDAQPVIEPAVEPRVLSNSSSTVLTKQLSVTENQKGIEVNSISEDTGKTNGSLPESQSLLSVTDSPTNVKDSALCSPLPAPADTADGTKLKCKKPENEPENRNTQTDVKESSTETLSTPSTEIGSVPPPPNAPSRARARLPKATPNLGSSRRGVGSSRQPDEDPLPPIRRPPPVQRLAIVPEPTAKPAPIPVQRVAIPSESPTKRPPPAQRVVALQEQTTNVPAIESPAEPYSLPDDVQLVDDDDDAEKSTGTNTAPEIGSHLNQPRAPPAAKRTTNVDMVAQKAKVASTLVTNVARPGRAAERRHSFRGADRDEFAPRKKRSMRRDPPPERNKMTMQDLIYWNPTTNPMKYADEADSEEANEVILSPIAEEAESPHVVPASEEPEEVPPDEEIDQENEDEDDAMPMPQVKIGPDGNIIIDEKSLVIETTASKKNVDSGDIVYEKSSNTTYSSYRKRRRAKVWSDRETTKFYRVLNSVGADFSMMTSFFPNRSRYELKLKFNREDRFNRDLIDKAINDGHHFDISVLEGENFEDDEEEVGSEAGSVASSKRGRGGRRRAVVEDQENVDSSKSPARGRRQHGRGRGRGAGKRRPRRPSVYASDGSSGEEEEEEQMHLALAEPHPPTPRKEVEIVVPDAGALQFDLDNPLNMNTVLTPNRLEQPILIQDDNDSLASEEEAEGEDEENNDEIQVLLSTPGPTRAGRQPKRPQLFAAEDGNLSEVRKRRKTGASTCAPRPSPVIGNAPPAVLPHLTLSPTKAESRLVFVPTRTPDQLIHVYMLSPVNSSPNAGVANASGVNATPTTSPLLTRPGVARSPSGTTPSPGSSPLCYSVGSSPIIISPVHYPGIRSPPALRVTQKNFVPNLSTANRSGRFRPPHPSSILARALSSPPLFNQPSAAGIRLATMTTPSSQTPVLSPAGTSTTTVRNPAPMFVATASPVISPVGVTHITVENRTSPAVAAGSATPRNNTVQSNSPIKIVYSANTSPSVISTDSPSSNISVNNSPLNINRTPISCAPSTSAMQSPSVVCTRPAAHTPQTPQRLQVARTSVRPMIYCSRSPSGIVRAPVQGTPVTPARLKPVSVTTPSNAPRNPAPTQTVTVVGASSPILGNSPQNITRSPKTPVVQVIVVPSIGPGRTTTPVASGSTLGTTVIHGPVTPKSAVVCAQSSGIGDATSVSVSPHSLLQVNATSSPLTPRSVSFSTPLTSGSTKAINSASVPISSDVTVTTDVTSTSDAS